MRLSEIFGVTTDYLLKNDGFMAIKPSKAAAGGKITLGYRLYKRLFNSGLIYALAGLAQVLVFFLEGGLRLDYGGNFHF